MYSIMKCYWKTAILQCTGSSVKVEQPCFVQCKGLTTSDYVDLTWTTFAEFPGKSIIYIYVQHFFKLKFLYKFIYGTCKWKPILSLSFNRTVCDCFPYWKNRKKVYDGIWILCFRCVCFVGKYLHIKVRISIHVPVL